jgi:hypothetical protein
MAITGEGLKVDGIGHFLSDHFLKVPTNQRSYAWEKDEVKYFWMDILAAMDDPHAEDYFIGSLVLAKTDGDHLEVVDGQQRLATTTIIISAIRDYYLETNNQQRASVVESPYLLVTDEVSLDKRPRLSLNTEDDLFFQKHVVFPHPGAGARPNPLEEPLRARRRIKPSNKNIAEASRSIREFVRAYAGTGRPEDVTARLTRVLMYIKQNVKMIAVTVPSHDDAYTIFETLNDRGLELSKADLLKNHLFRMAGRHKSDLEAQWHAMTGALETVSRKNITVDYIRYLWIALNGHVRTKDLYTSIKRTTVSTTQAVYFAHKLSDNAAQYASILNSDHPKWQQFGDSTRTDLSTIITLGIERLHPITLAVVSNFAVDEVKKAMYYLVCASVRILIASPSPGGVFEEQIAKVAPKVTSGEITTAAQLATAMNKEIVPADPDFEVQFTSARVSQPGLARYYLRALENQRANDSMPARVATKDLSKGTLEHILPQSPSGAWAHFKPDAVRAYWNRIGNLALLTEKDNTDADNDDFQTVKVPVYRRAEHFALTRELAKVKDLWNEDEIEKRQKKLAILAVKAWPREVK